MKIDNVTISKDSVYFIAEVGVNHNGDIETAKRLIDAAKRSGADAVKFQTFKARHSVSEGQEKADYQKENTTSTETQFEMLKRLELTSEDHKELKSYCDSNDITFISTPAAHPSNAELLIGLDVAAIKIGSSDLTNKILLERCARANIPLVISTGMSTLEEVKAAHRVITSTNRDVEVAFLHCVSEYPTALEDVNLRSIGLLDNELKTPVGFSDHTTSVRTPAYAVSAGATIIEKHLTLDQEMSGPDHQASLEPPQFRDSVSYAREAATARGTFEKKPTKSEETMAQEIRRSLHLSRAVEAGEELTKDMLVVKRPNDGSSAMKYEELVGKSFRWDMSEGDPVTESDVEP